VVCEIPGMVTPALAEDTLKVFAEYNLLLKKLLRKLLKAVDVGRDHLFGLFIRLFNDLLGLCVYQLCRSLAVGLREAVIGLSR